MWALMVVRSAYDAKGGMCSLDCIRMVEGEREITGVEGDN